MNKKLLMPIILAVILLGVVFVSAKFITSSQDGYNHNIELSLQKGWNLILATPIMGVYEGDDYADDTIASDSEIKRENIKAVYFYSRDSNKYLQMYPNAQEYNNYLKSLRSKALSKEDESYILFSSAWIYVDKTGVLKYSRVDVPKYNETSLKSGWNFLTITPEMAGKDLGSIMGDCNVEQFTYWDAGYQKWESYSQETFRQKLPAGANINWGELLFAEEYQVGYGVLFKVTSNCNLGESQEIITPPAIP